MVGEFEYLTSFIESIGSNNERTGNPLNPFPEIALTFIFVFLLLMSIILMNLLVRNFKLILKHFIGYFFWFSIECRKTKTKVITLANHIGHRQYIGTNQNSK